MTDEEIYAHLDAVRFTVSASLCPRCGTFPRKTAGQPWKCLCQTIFNKPCPFNSNPQEGGK